MWSRGYGKQGANVTILDEKERPFGDLSKYDILVRSPGVYRYRPELEGLNATSKTKIFLMCVRGRLSG